MISFPSGVRVLIYRILAQIRILSFLLLIRAAFAVDSPSRQSEVLEPYVVNRWVGIMLTNHPGLRSFEATARSSRLQVDAVRYLADPKVLLGGAVYSEKGMNPSEEGNLIYGIEQPLPIMGKEKASRMVANAEAEREIARVEVQRQGLKRDLTIALFRAALAHKTVDLAMDDLVWVADLAQLAANRLVTGNSSGPEALRLQMEQSRRSVELERLRAQESQFLSTVNRLLGSDPDNSLPAFLLPGIAQPLSGSKRWVELALASEPRLKALEKERLAAQAILESTRRSKRPDLAFGVDGRQFAGSGEFRQGTLSLSINFPIWNRSKFDIDIARDRERLRSVELNQKDQILEVREELHHIKLRLDTARREALLYQDEVLPRATSTYQAFLAQWSSGRGDLRDVLESRRSIVETQLKMAEAITEQWSALAELVLCCGLEDLSTLIDPAPSNTPTSFEFQPGNSGQ